VLAHADQCSTTWLPVYRVTSHRVVQCRNELDRGCE
jgi:hypothetical protein